MPTINRTKSAIKISNVAQVVYNTMMRINTPCTIDNMGNCYYFVGGDKIPMKDFIALYPTTGEPIRLKGANPDSTKIS